VNKLGLLNQRDVQTVRDNIQQILYGGELSSF